MLNKQIFVITELVYFLRFLQRAIEAFHYEPNNKILDKLAGEICLKIPYFTQVMKLK